MPPSPDAREVVHRYHDGTKHHFHRFARSLGYLDWASQPKPFRAFLGSPTFPLYPSRGGAPGGYIPEPVAYDRLFDAPRAPRNPEPRDPMFRAALIGDLLRHALGLSAWKRFRDSHWSLRVNPSSGNLHPTEAYVICGGTAGLSETPGVYHYAADRHALELRCTFNEPTWLSACAGQDDVVLVALTSIHWREAWKYGERAFRYCQHDLGHAIAALAFAGALVHRRAEILTGWSHQGIATLTGTDRDGDFFEAEREDPACVIALSSVDGADRLAAEHDQLVDAIRGGVWYGRASQLSEDHTQWTFIDEVARATEWAGRAGRAGEAGRAGGERLRPYRAEAMESRGEASAKRLDARAVILQRRSAVALDGRSSIDRARFLSMLSRVMPAASTPWSALWWPPAIHLALFVHRVDGLSPGLYLLPRARSALGRLRAAMVREFLWEVEDENMPLICLARGDCTSLSARMSCDQEIASDGYFSFGMLADFDASLDAYGPFFYRHLFWESGVVGQVMYLEAEAAGARATGIGCFYDDPVHDLLGLHGHTFQSLYHFTVGIPVEDGRLTTEPGYEWER